MRKLIAILGAAALCANLAPAEQKSVAQLSDAVYDVQKGKDSVNQIEVLRVKGAATVGGAMTVAGVLTASGGVGGSGASLTSLPAGQLTGNIAVARITNALETCFQSGTCTNGQTISFTPAFGATPIVSAIWFGLPAETNASGNVGALYIESVSTAQFVVKSTVDSTNMIHWTAMNVL